MIIRAGVIGEPKSGKTRLITDLPWGEEPFGDKAALVAWDPNSRNLESVLVDNREHLYVDWPKEYIEKNTKVYSPFDEAVRLAEWADSLEDVRTIIWDTGSQTVDDLLYAIAAQGMYTREGNMVVRGSKGSLTVPIPTPGDYGATQRAFIYFLKRVLLEQNKNLIMSFHIERVHEKIKNKQGDYVDGELVLAGPMAGGPAAVEKVASIFTNLFRVALEPKAGGKYQRTVYTTKHKQYLAGLASSLPVDPIQQYDLDAGSGKDFWRAVARAMKGTK